MKLTVKTGEAADAAVDLLAIPLPQRADDDGTLSGRLARLDERLGGAIGAVIASGDFRGRKGQTQLVYPGADAKPRRVLLIGLGKEAAIDAERLRRCAGSAVGRALAVKATRVALAVPPIRRVRPGVAAQALAEGATLGAYRFDRYQEKSDDTPAPIDSVDVFFERIADARSVRRSAAHGAVIAESQNVARELSNEPGNALPPAKLASEAQRVAREVGLVSKVLGPAELEKRGMGAILAVGGGSANKPRLIVLQHNAARQRKGAKSLPTVCIVGKGITFDSGGISIKPSAGMQDMKHDMGGAAAVVGALRAAALLKLPLHVVGVIGAAENLPSGTAYRPGDVVRSMSGKTIEVLNTDAEGRLVLADALHYAVSEFEPRAMIDLATLTGACMVALGPWATGLFTTNDALRDELRGAGDRAGERAWPLPLLDEHREAMRSTVADLKNTGGRDAGASTAAGFLSAFVGDTPWAHLDIAGTGWTDKQTPVQPRGATGVGVRLLVEWLRETRVGRGSARGRSTRD